MSIQKQAGGSRLATKTHPHRISEAVYIGFVQEGPHQLGRLLRYRVLKA